jgi:predicted transcriptional regulator
MMVGAFVCCNGLLGTETRINRLNVNVTRINARHVGGNTVGVFLDERRAVLIEIAGRRQTKEGTVPRARDSLPPRSMLTKLSCDVARRLLTMLERHAAAIQDVSCHVPNDSLASFERDVNTIAQDALEQYVDHDHWFSRKVAEGLATLDRGESVLHEDVQQRIERLFRG